MPLESQGGQDHAIPSSSTQPTIPNEADVASDQFVPNDNACDNFIPNEDSSDNFVPNEISSDEFVPTEFIPNDDYVPREDTTGDNVIPIEGDTPNEVSINDSIPSNLQPELVPINVPAVDDMYESLEEEPLPSIGTVTRRGRKISAPRRLDL